MAVEKVGDHAIHKERVDSNPVVFSSRDLMYSIKRGSLTLSVSQ